MGGFEEIIAEVIVFAIELSPKVGCAILSLIGVGVYFIWFN